jgi:hypothetical protein
MLASMRVVENFPHALKLNDIITEDFANDSPHHQDERQNTLRTFTFMYDRDSFDQTAFRLSSHNKRCGC